MHKEVWGASFGEALTYEREADDTFDRCTTAVIENPIPDMEKSWKE